MVVVVVVVIVVCISCIERSDIVLYAGRDAYVYIYVYIEEDMAYMCIYIWNYVYTCIHIER